MSCLLVCSVFLCILSPLIDDMFLLYTLSEKINMSLMYCIHSNKWSILLNHISFFPVGPTLQNHHSTL